MPDYGERQIVGVPTGLLTQAGRPMYETPYGEMVSEKSVTLPINGFFYNVPSIHQGVQYTEDQIYNMLVNGMIEPTSVHPTMEEAITAAELRSSGLLGY